MKWESQKRDQEPEPAAEPPDLKMSPYCDAVVFEIPYNTELLFSYEYVTTQQGKFQIKFQYPRAVLTLLYGTRVHDSCIMQCTACHWCQHWHLALPLTLAKHWQNTKDLRNFTQACTIGIAHAARRRPWPPSTRVRTAIAAAGISI